MIRDSIDVIDQISYEIGQASGYIDGCDIGYETGYRVCQIRNKRIARLKKAKQLYFMQQKMLGVILLILSFFVTRVLDGDITFAVLIVPLSLGLIFTKHRWIYDRRR